MLSAKAYDVVILGGGITGSALMYVLSNYTNISSVALVEKYSELGQVNSHSSCNSQTLHFGDIETNYALDEALVVKQAAEMTVRYLERFHEDDGDVYIRGYKMVLGVGEEEIEKLMLRWRVFKNMYPRLQYLTCDEIAAIEPSIVEGRSKHEALAALKSDDGYVVDYGRLAQSFVKHSYAAVGTRCDVHFDTAVKNIERHYDAYEVYTNGCVIRAPIVIVALGAYSLRFAKMLGYGNEFMLLPVAGNFYCSVRKILHGKVYTVQHKKLPFAAVHGDPNIRNMEQTRFGPTTKVLPMLERRNISSVVDFLLSEGADIDSIASIAKVLSDPVIFKFVMKNLLYDMPYVGRRSFLKSIQKIAPAVELRDLHFGKGIGGIRPQMIHKKKRELIMGKGEIVGDNIIFNVTPSPGATAALQTAEMTAHTVMRFFRGAFHFEEEAFERDLKINNHL